MLVLSSCPISLSKCCSAPSFMTSLQDTTEDPLGDGKVKVRRNDRRHVLSWSPRPVHDDPGKVASRVCDSWHFIVHQDVAELTNHTGNLPQVSRGYSPPLWET